MFCCMCAVGCLPLYQLCHNCLKSSLWVWAENLMRRKTFIWGLALALTCGLGGQRQLLLWQCLMEGVMFCWKSRRTPANWIFWWFREWKRNSAEVKRLAWIILFPLLPACFCPSVGYSHGFLWLKTEGERQRLVYFYSNEISCLPNSVSGAKIKEKTPRST